MSKQRPFAAGIVLLLAIMIAPIAALASPQVTATSPAYGTTVNSPPPSVVFTLDSIISPADYYAIANGTAVTTSSGDSVYGTWDTYVHGATSIITFTPEFKLPNDTYTFFMSADLRGNGVTCYLTFTVDTTLIFDTTPPGVNANPSGGIFNYPQPVTLIVTEPASIYYTLDGSTPTTRSALFREPIVLPASASIRYFAVDLAGNASDVTTSTYVIDTTPPVLAISTLRNGAYTNNEILNIAGTVRDDTEVRGITINGTSVPFNGDGSFSHALLLKPGSNAISVSATDAAGNLVAETRTVTLDQTAPVLAVSAPADNSKTGTYLLDIKGTLDKTSTVTVRRKDMLQNALMDNGTFTATIHLEPGYNTLEITATDLAGNQSSLKRTVLYDDQRPSLAIIEPTQDIRTNRNSLIIKGTANDPHTAVGVSITKDSELFAPPVIDGTFEQAVTFTEEKTYTVTVSATNEVGTSTTVQRNVIFDITPPALAIYPVTSPTAQSNQSIYGTREPGATVTVTCPTATAGTVVYPTATTWQVELFGLAEGANVITATSADEAGNVVSASATVVFAQETATPTITLSVSPDQIWSPNHKLVPVTISGGVEANGTVISSVAISVRDEYEKCDYSNVGFGSVVMLDAWRKGTDKNGREYTVTVTVTDRNGQTTTKSASVVVPHKAPPRTSGIRKLRSGNIKTGQLQL